MLYQLSVFSERKINFWCEELDYSDSFLGIRSAQLSYCYFLVKLLDLFDTVFFVLRKRTRQISFLHVYHHVLILIGAYIAVAWAPGNPQQYFSINASIKMCYIVFAKLVLFNYIRIHVIQIDKSILNTLLFFFPCAGGHPWVFGTLNCFVHIIMYGYYFGSVFNPKLKANLMIKRSITQLQIVSMNLSQITKRECNIGHTLVSLFSIE